jgi:hypothetical protein
LLCRNRSLTGFERDDPSGASYTTRRDTTHIFAQEAAETAFVLRARVESLHAAIMALPSDPIRDRVLTHLRSVLARDIPSPLL